MSLFDNNLYQWRETYFVFHQQANRPSAAQVQEMLQALSLNLEIEDLKADENGQFISATVFAPEAYSAIDMGFVIGDEVDEQLETLRPELRDGITAEAERAKISRLAECDARLDLLHFELMVDFGDEDEEFVAAFDPMALLTVMESLMDLCDGVGVDPAAATVM
jgi:hypothetical protein